MTTDKRLFERFTVDLPARFKGYTNKPDDRIVVQDISAQGAKLISKERFFLNDNVALEVLMPLTGEIVELQGQVVWVNTVEPQTSWSVGISCEGEKFMKLGKIFEEKKNPPDHP